MSNKINSNINWKVQTKNLVFSVEKLCNTGSNSSEATITTGENSFHLRWNNLHFCDRANLRFKFIAESESISGAVERWRDSKKPLKFTWGDKANFYTILFRFALFSVLKFICRYFWTATNQNVKILQFFYIYIF